jgi:hypothetical protein
MLSPSSGATCSVGLYQLGPTEQAPPEDRLNPVSETLCALNKTRTVDSVQTHNNFSLIQWVIGALSMWIKLPGREAQDYMYAPLGLRCTTMN